MTARELLNPRSITDVDHVDSRLHDLQTRKCVTELDTKQQEAVTYSSLTDKIRNSCRDISLEHLNQEDGLKLLTEKLEKLCVKDSKASAYLAYEKCEPFQ